MARFNKPVETNTFTKTTTHEGGGAWTPDNPATELLFTAAVTYVGEDTFYESAEVRSKRLVDLVHKSVARNPRITAEIARQLRDEFKIRTAAILVGCEYVAAGGPNGRAVIDSVCQRADEPGEVLAYWFTNHGRKLPRAIKTGLGDACRRLYTEKNAIKYDTASKGFRFADVLELCHVAPDAPWQSALYKYVLDDRHHGDAVPAHDLVMLKQHEFLNGVAEDGRRVLLREQGFESLANAGFTWERLSSWLPGGMDAEAWEAIIPSMGVMALVRNLRNFDEKGINKTAVNTVISKITDPVEVEKSRIFPYQVLLAYQHAPSDNWKRALGDTVDLASGNLPRLDGSLIVIDTSSSMTAMLSQKSKANRVTVAALQAAAIARHSRDCDVVIFADGNRNVTSEVRGRSVLGAAAYVHSRVGSVGMSTNGHTAIRDHWDSNKHKRALIFTDDQMHDSVEPSSRPTYRYTRGVDISHVPQVVTFNVVGYNERSMYGKGRITVVGFSDAIFNAVAKILQIEASEPTGTII